MSEKIAFFDFDGTITTRDSLLEFIKFCKGKTAFIIGMAICSPYLIAFKLKLIPNYVAKEKVLAYFFNGMAIDQFNELASAFAKKNIPALLRPRAVAKIHELKENGFTIAIVSASPENWVASWADTLHLPTISTKMQVVNGKITGKIDGQNCHGAEKVRRIKELYDLADFSEILAYGDSSGDKEMLAIANPSYMKPFRENS